MAKQMVNVGDTRTNDSENATVLNVTSRGRGYSITFRVEGRKSGTVTSQQRFLQRFPYELTEV